ncbi:DinB family protein [Mucilaginibacter phyllosphaerae]
MLHYLNQLEENRKLLLNHTANLNEHQYNLVPPGYNNNIIWNMGHLLVVSENILYKDSPYHRPVQELIKPRFQRGSQPEDVVSDDEILLIRHSLMQTAGFYIKTMGIGEAIEELGASSNSVVPLVSEERMQFLLFHEQIHYNRINRLMQLVTQNS